MKYDNVKKIYDRLLAIESADPTLVIIYEFSGQGLFHGLLLFVIITFDNFVKVLLPLFLFIPLFCEHT